MAHCPWSLILAAGIFISLGLIPVSAQSLPPRPFDIGWVGQIYEPQKLAAYAQLGVRVMTADGAGWYLDTVGTSNDYFKNYLTEANKYGIKVTFKLSHGNSNNNGTPYDSNLSATQNTAAFTKLLTTINRTTYPNLDDWIIGDEPNLDENNPPVVYQFLSQSPGYYQLTQNLDPGHALIIFCCYLNYPYSAPYTYTEANYAGLTNKVGWDYFPGNISSQTGVWRSYDQWQQGLTYATTYQKNYLAWGQGFGSNGYRNLTYDEIRYHTFTAIALGMPKFYFWNDDPSWTNTTMVSLSNQMIAQVQNIGAQMKTGITNSSQITVNPSNSSQLIYRYGISGNDHALLAINIANRNSASGTALNNVTFTLPNQITASSVTVLDENRTLPITNHQFADSFSPFAVHVYTFSSAAATNPDDYDGDTDVDYLDYLILAKNFGQTLQNQFINLFSVNRLVKNI
jgi:hypothetical protein